MQLNSHRVKTLNSWKMLPREQQFDQISDAFTSSAFGSDLISATLFEATLIL